MRRLFFALIILAFSAPIGASAQSTCRDGTSSRSSGRGACSHHGGVAKAADPAPTKPATAGNIVLPTNPEPAAAPAKAPARASTSSPSTEQASGVKVWVNTKSGVYHCPGSRWYGATKSGEYETESQARAAGNLPAYGRSCG